MFGKIIYAIVISLVLVYPEFLLQDSIFHPMKVHVPSL